MKISNLSRVADGEICNSFSVNTVNFGHTDPQKVKRGDFFIGNDIVFIKLALSNGAYAIMTENPQIELDHEIAWIQVQNIQKAELKILRYHLATCSEFIFLNPVAYCIAKQIVTSHNVFFLDAIEENFSSLFANKFPIIIYKNSDYVDAFKTLQSKNIPPKQTEVINQTLLHSTFVHDGLLHTKVPIVSLFFENLIDVLQIAIAYTITTDIQRLEYFEPLVPQFIDNKYNLKEFGKSEKIFFHIPSFAFIEKLSLHLQQLYPFRNRCIIDAQTQNIEIQSSHFILSQVCLEKLQDKLNHQFLNNQNTLF